MNPTDVTWLNQRYEPLQFIENYVTGISRNTVNTASDAVLLSITSEYLRVIYVLIYNPAGKGEPTPLQKWLGSAQKNGRRRGKPFRFFPVVNLLKPTTAPPVFLCSTESYRMSNVRESDEQQCYTRLLPLAGYGWLNPDSSDPRWQQFGSEIHRLWRDSNRKSETASGTEDKQCKPTSLSWFRG
jgi:hypothetical protein